MASKKAPPKETLDFEKALAELNLLVDQMEQGGLSLEKSLQHFERGIHLVNICQSALKKAEQKVQLLTEQNGKNTLIPFEGEIES
jgi:exodeoxyribonuclease VII small subunit